jgi:ribose transport system permease protein
VSRFSVLPHVVWEAVLLVLALVVTMLGVSEGHVFRSWGPWPQLAVLGTLAAGAALSLRTRTPNLAVGAIAALSGVLYAMLLGADWPLGLAAPVVVLAALGFGVLLAVIVGLTGAPAWAVSLGGLGVASTIGLANGTTLRPIASAAWLTPGWLTAFAALFVVGSLAGGALWLVPGVRSGVRATAVDGEPAPGVGRRLLAALVGLGGSSLLAGLAGVLAAGRVGVGVFNGSEGSLLFAVAAAVLGGLSLTGRGGGIAGTVLASYLLVMVQILVRVNEGPGWAATYLPTSVAILLGVLVSRLLDWFASRSGSPSGAPAPAPYLPGGYPHLAYPLAGYPHPAYPGAGVVPAQPGAPASAPTPPGAPAQPQPAAPTPPQQPAAPAPPAPEPPPGG